MSTEHTSDIVLRIEGSEGIKSKEVFVGTVISKEKGDTVLSLYVTCDNIGMRRKDYRDLVTAKMKALYFYSVHK